MTWSGPRVGSGSTLRDHRFHRLRVAEVVTETAEAVSLVLAVPEDLAETFSYEPGQFCNLRVDIEGEPQVRCYSMSSAPAVDDVLAVTVKRVPGGLVSNWLVDRLGPGDELEVSPPTGFFQLTASDAPLLAYAAGSGITPVFSLIKTALATTERAVYLLYANRDRESVIFGPELRALSERHPDRFALVERLDDEEGYVDADAVRAFLGGSMGAIHYICGPTPFMDVVEQTLLSVGVDDGSVHIERYTPMEQPVAEPDDEDGVGATATRVTIELDGRTDSTDHHPGTTILQAARQMGMSPATSCEAGSCATCMARLVEGSVSMFVNNALTPDEVDEGWILTCQSVPTSPTVHVIYGWED
jgi:ferredoxin-NADP reductase